MKWFIFSAIFLAGILKGEPLTVGMELSYPPFEMMCQESRPCGISVDFVTAFGKFLGKEVEIKNLAFVGLVPSLQNGSIDLIVSSLTITAQRKKVIDFSDPYAVTGLCLLLSLTTDAADVLDLNEASRVVVVKSGTSGEVYAVNHLQNATVRTLSKESACVLEVIQAKADAFIYDQLSVYTNWQKNKGTTRANLVPFQKEYWAFGIKKGNRDLLDQANAFIKQFRADGGFNQLGEKYLPEQKEAFEKMGVPFVF